MKNIYEILDEFQSASTTEEKKAVLTKNDHFALRCVLRAAFHPKIQFVFDSVPKYKPSDAPPGLSPSNTAMEMNRLYLFEVGNPRVSPNLTDRKKELLFVQLLESLEAREAEVWCRMIQKKLNVPGLTAKLVEEVFPGVLA